jgi:hypothetical protein
MLSRAPRRPQVREPPSGCRHGCRPSPCGGGTPTTPHGPSAPGRCTSKPLALSPLFDWWDPAGLRWDPAGLRDRRWEGISRGSCALALKVADLFPVRGSSGRTLWTRPEGCGLIPGVDEWTSGRVDRRARERERVWERKRSQFSGRGGARATGLVGAGKPRGRSRRRAPAVSGPRFQGRCPKPTNSHRVTRASLGPGRAPPRSSACTSRPPTGRPGRLLQPGRVRRGT